MATDDIAIAEYLINQGADVNARDNVGGTPLMKAAKNSKFNVVKLLILNGAEMQAVDNSGNTPLVYSVNRAKFNSDYKVARLLLDVDREHPANVLKKILCQLTNSDVGPDLKRRKLNDEND